MTHSAVSPAPPAEAAPRRRRGRAPGPPRRIICVRVPAALLGALQARARAVGTSPSAAIRAAIRWAVEAGPADWLRHHGGLDP